MIQTLSTPLPLVYEAFVEETSYASYILHFQKKILKGIVVINLSVSVQKNKVLQPPPFSEGGFLDTFSTPTNVLFNVYFEIDVLGNSFLRGFLFSGC